MAGLMEECLQLTVPPKGEGIRFIEGEKKGSKVLIYANNIFHIDRYRAAEWTPFKCSLSHRKRCRARVKVRGLAQDFSTWTGFEVLHGKHRGHVSCARKILGMEGGGASPKKKLKLDRQPKKCAGLEGNCPRRPRRPRHICLFCCEPLPISYRKMAYLENEVPAYHEGEDRLRISLNDPVKNLEAFSVLCTRLGVDWRKRETFDPAGALPLCLKCHDLHQTLFQLQVQIGELEKLIDKHAQVIRATIERSEVENRWIEETGGGGRSTQLRLLGLDLFRKQVLGLGDEWSAPEVNSDIIKQEIDELPPSEHFSADDEDVMSCFDEVKVEMDMDAKLLDSESPPEVNRENGEDTLEPPQRRVRYGMAVPLNYKCPKCGKGYQHKYALRRHMILHNRRKPALNRRKVIRGSGQGQKKRSEPVPEKNPTSPDAKLASPQPKELKPTRLKCHLCWELIPGGTKYADLHFQDKHPDHSGGASTCRCGKPYTSYRSCFKHSRRHHSGIAKGYPCDKCSKAYHTQNELTRHKWRGHVPLEQRRTFVCHICGVALAEASNLEGHMKIHSENAERHVCEMCGKSYADKSSLRDHMKIQHLGIRDHKCSDCDKAFSCRADLKRHLRTHGDSGVKPFSCQTCGREFLRKGSLTRHETVTHGAVPKWKPKRKSRKKIKDGASVPCGMEGVGGGEAGEGETMEETVEMQAASSILSLKMPTVN